MEPDQADQVPSPGSPAYRSRASVPDMVLLGLALASTAPALLVRYPESVDYLNHLARLYVLTQPPASAVHEFYQVHWHLVPNLALDLAATALSWALSAETVMKGAWIACVLGLAAATWFLHRSLYRRSEPTLALCGVGLINLPLTYGFISFALGLPVALAAVGMWFRLGDRPSLRVLAALNAIAAVIVVMHVAAAASLLLTLAAIHVWRAPLRPWAMARRGLEIGAGFLLPAVLLAIANLTGPRIATDTVMYSVQQKMRLLVSPVYTGNVPLDAASAIAVVVVLFAALAAGRGQSHPRLVPALVAWAVVLVAIPDWLGPEAAVGARLGIFPFMLLIASLAAARPNRVASALTMTMAAAIVITRVAYLVPEFRAYNRQVDAFRVATSAVAPGSRVLNALAPHVADPTCRANLSFGDHLPSLLVIERNAFVSTQFADDARQTIRLAPAVHAIASPDAPIMPWEALVVADAPGGVAKLMSVDPEGAWDKAAIDWRRHYDYLALLRPDCTSEIPPDPGLVPIGESDIYRIYRIRHDG
jgi:hypothetical protein